ncbi:MAG: ATP-dependent DNA helicase [Deltaproteobacteria bacterium]|nr:ATP-dependent DNA helicase [Deltaproteobacteria bacterium]
MHTFFSSDGPLAANLVEYEFRPDQALMAQAVEALLEAPEQGMPGQPRYAKILLAEAETGIGKSLAYLVPAVLSSQRIVVSTATINLQDQLIEKEIPLLAQILKEEIPALCVKGRQNYLCHYRWYQLRSSAQLSFFDNDDCDRIENWLETTDTGDRSELDWLPDRSTLWPKISAHSYQCLGNECPEASLCFINRLRKKAGSARILVVNHHLYFSDLVLRQRGYGELLPRHEAVIFDEAHHLENIATTFFGSSFSQYQIYDLVSDITQQASAELSVDSGDRLITHAQGLKQRAEHFISLFPEERGRFNLSEFVSKQQNWHQEVQLIGDALQRLAKELQEHSHKTESWQVMAERALELQQTLFFVGLPEDQSQQNKYVYWYERRERAVSLSATPVEVAEDLRRTLYSMIPSCILTSATLSSSGRFDYICQRLGLDDQIETLQLKSPFDYHDRTRLYIPEDRFPEPADIHYISALGARVEALLSITRGRALVLFTSFKGMDAVADYLEGRLDYPVLVQGTASRSKLLSRFREQTDSVLLAVASFWEGVDISGESLSAVIIDKLPFEVPSDPVVQARMQAIKDDGGNPFFDFQIPRAVLTLRQGVGRLMRSARDCGVISIMDIRLFSKRYGKLFLRSLPPSPVIRDTEDVRAFFAEIDAHQ